MRQYKSKPVESQQFELDGVVFTVPGNMFLLDLVELAKMADLEVTDPRAISAVSALFRDILGEDYDRFHAHCKAHNTDNGTLIEIIQDMVQESIGGTGFPTVQPSDSVPGMTNTGHTYTVVSPSEGTVVQFPLTPDRETELRTAVAKAEMEWKTG